MNLLDKTLVLKLNRNWQVIDEMSVASAITFLCSESHGKKPGFALDITTAVDENGEHVLVNAQPTPWEDWVKLPVRESDLYIGVGRSEFNPEGRVRVPLVVICANYDKVPIRKRIAWSPDAVRRRDKDICQVTKRRLAPGEGNTGHIKARSKGGEDSFENTIYMDKRLNTLQGTKTPEEMGWTIPQPKAPLPVPPVVRLRENPKHPVWKPFLKA